MIPSQRFVRLPWGFLRLSPVALLLILWSCDPHEVVYHLSYKLESDAVSQIATVSYSDGQGKVTLLHNVALPFSRDFDVTISSVGYSTRVATLSVALVSTDPTKDGTLSASTLIWCTKNSINANSNFRQNVYNVFLNQPLSFNQTARAESRGD